MHLLVRETNEQPMGRWHEHPSCKGREQKQAVERDCSKVTGLQLSVTWESLCEDVTFEQRPGISRRERKSVEAFEK